MSMGLLFQNGRTYLAPYAKSRNILAKLLLFSVWDAFFEEKVMASSKNASG